MDAEGGRRWRPLRDVADEAPILYVTPPQCRPLRRAANRLLHRRRSDLARGRHDHPRAFRRETLDRRLLAPWASGGSTTPSVKTYTYDDVIATLQSVEPYDWRALLRQADCADSTERAAGRHRERGLAPRLRRHAIGPLEGDGRRSTATVDVSLSAGFIVSTDDAQAGGSGSIVDVEPGSPAARAGIAPGMRLAGGQRTKVVGRRACTTRSPRRRRRTGRSSC